MVPIRVYKRFWEQIASHIGCTLTMIVSDESELQKKIKEVDAGQKILIAVIPSSDFSAQDRDNVSEIDTCFVFILVKSDAASLTEDELFNEREMTQNMMIHAKTEMMRLADDMTTHPDEPAHLMRHLAEGKIHTDPEYNYLGCNGWSISFALRTLGINNQNY